MDFKLGAVLVSEDGPSAGGGGGSYDYFVDGSQVSSGTIGLRNDYSAYWDSAGALAPEVATIIGDDEPKADR